MTEPVDITPMLNHWKRGDAAHYADLLSLNTALEELGRWDKRKLELLELQYFSGLGFREVANVHCDLRLLPCMDLC